MTLAFINDGDLRQLIKPFGAFSPIGKVRTVVVVLLEIIGSWLGD